MKRISYLLFLTVVFQLSAQIIPVDPNVKIGVLGNGMKYYIRHNEKPEDKVEMYIVINAGSILEDDDQQGLAHFMEHMNFNGTKHYPDNKLVDFLQSIGIKFGQHLNAYTSFDETVYMLPVPLDKKENLDAGLLVLEDWAFNATLSGEQIDKERGVVLEELRIGLGAEKRMRDRYFPKLFYKSRYANRLPIGNKKLLETFTYDKIRRFHKEWYRPNLMAVIVVGDIDVAEVEQKVKVNFGKYKNPENARDRKTFTMPNHKETLVAVETDPDATMSRVQLIYKDQLDFKPSGTVAEYNQSLIDNLYSIMMDNRIDELINSNNPPFTYGGVGYQSLLRPKHALSGFAITKAGGQLDALKVLIDEIERAKKFGFTEGELERAKSEILSQYETAYQDRAKTQSRGFVQEYINNFLQNEPIAGIEWEYKQVNNIVPSIALSQINTFAKDKVTKNNRVVIITGPEKDGVKYPTESEVLALFDEARLTNLKPYEDKAVIKYLVAPFTERGSIKKTKKNKKLGTITWTLSNGAKVTLKTTNFKDDEILFKAVSLGGTSVLSDDEFLKTQFAFGALNEAGFNSHSQVEIQKYLQGKQVDVSSSIGELYELVSGSTTKKDMPCMMEMIYAYFTGLNYDIDSYNAYKEKQSGFLESMLSNPRFYFSNEFSKFMNKNNPRFTNIIPLEQDWKRTDYKRAYDIYKKKFADADDFHFYFVGNIDKKQLKPYVEQYIATLPSNKGSENIKKSPYKLVSGEYQKIFKKGKDPKSMVVITMYGDAKYSMKEDIALQALGEIATIKVIEKLREDESGIYGGGASGGMSKVPSERYNFAIQFPCGPENVESLTQNAVGELQKLIDNGPSQKDLDKYKKGEINDLHVALKTNDYWLSQLENQYVKGEKVEDFLKKEEMIKTLTVDNIKAVAQKYLNGGNKIKATLMPEDGWEENVSQETIKQSAVTIKQVLDEYLKALGGKDKLESVKTVYMESTSKVMGMEVKGVTKLMTPNKMYTKQVAMGKETVQVFDGEKGYMSQSGQKMDLPANMVQQLKSKRIFDILTFKPEDFSAIETVELEDKQYNVLTKGEDKFYFDAQTGLLYKTKSAQAESTVLEYVTIEGVKYPSKLKQSIQGMIVELQNQNIQFNAKVTADDFK